MDDQVTNGKKEILIRRDQTITFDTEGLYCNGNKVSKEEGDQRSIDKRVQAEKQGFYNVLFRQPFKHIVVLAAAGISR